MSRVFEVVTPEQVAIRYELAGIGSRGVAMAVDFLLQLVIYLVLFLIAGSYFNLTSLADDKFLGQMSHSIVTGILILVIFLINWGYYIAFETLWNGATPGKRLMGLRVVKDGGHPIDFRAALLRNLLRAVDALPGIPLLPIYGFGFVAVLSNGQYKRLGDMAAGTLVIRHGREQDLHRQIGFGSAEVHRLLDATVLSQLARLTRDEYRTVQHFLERRNKLTPAMRVEFARKLATPLMEKLAYQVPATGVDYERWLDELDLAYRTRALGPTTLAASSAPTASPAPVATPTIPTSPEQQAKPDDDTRRW